MNKLIAILAIVSLTLVGCGTQSGNEKQEKRIDTLTTAPFNAATGDASVIVPEENTASQAADKSDLKSLTEKEPDRSISEIFRSLEKPAQIFSISPDKDTTLVCAEGTSVKIKRNSFVSAGSGKEITGKIEIAVKEYYKLSDILISNLSTTSGKDILETGGMIYISATSGNENCVLKKSRAVELGFPYKQKKENMQLFQGDWNGNKVNWSLGNGDIVTVSEFNTDGIPVYNRVDHKFKKEFEESVDEKNIHDKQIVSVNRYLFSSSQLGWINCDRFYKNPAPKINYVVDGGESSEIHITLIFHSVKAVLMGYQEGSQYTFKNVPTGEKVTIVAIKKANTKTLLAIKETTIANSDETELSYQTVTVAKLKDEMKKLSSIN